MATISDFQCSANPFVSEVDQAADPWDFLSDRSTGVMSDAERDWLESSDGCDWSLNPWGNDTYWEDHYWSDEANEGLSTLLAA